MKIETRDFGIIDVEEENIITFKQPVFGFEDYTQFVLVTDSNMGNGICWLQSIEQKGICFIMLNPLEICPDYAPAVMQDVLFTLQAVPKDDLDCWVIAVIGDTFRESTVNLKSPIIINHKTNLGMQVILDQDYPIRQPIFDSKGGIMLILSRKKGESIIIGEDIEIFVADVKGDKVRLGISAPEDMKISRKELYLTVENNKEASDKVDLLKVFQLSRSLYAQQGTDKAKGKDEPDADTDNK